MIRRGRGFRLRRVGVVDIVAVGKKEVQEVQGLDSMISGLGLGLEREGEMAEAGAAGTEGEEGETVVVAAEETEVEDAEYVSCVERANPLFE